MSDDSKRLQCPICERPFTTRQKKENHVIVLHLNAGRFRCSHCPKTFQDKSHFERHVKIHKKILTEEKPFVCGNCQMRFKYESTLKTHLKLHSRKLTRVKPFETEKESIQHTKRTPKKDNLKKPGGKTFQCEACPKIFPLRDKLTRHFLDCHAKKTCFCPSCGKGFGRKGARDRHFRTHSAHTQDKRKPKRKPKSKPKRKRWEPEKDPPYYSKHSVIQRETPGDVSPGEDHLIREEDPVEMVVEVEPGEASCSSLGAAYSLRARSKTPNYGANIESEESSSSGSDGGDRDEKEEGIDGVFNEEPNDDEEVHGVDDPINRSQQIIEKNPDSDDQADNDVNMATAGHESRKPFQGAIPVITLSSDDESDKEDELPPQSSTVGNLKLSFEVDYRALQMSMDGSLSLFEVAQPLKNRQAFSYI